MQFTFKEEISINKRKKLTLISVIGVILFLFITFMILPPYSDTLQNSSAATQYPWGG